jgi:hypothetical protein
VRSSRPALVFAAETTSSRVLRPDDGDDISMKEIKAFVGHSFSEVDAEVVGKFTKYFDSLARSHPQFSWQSAERAEPRILTEKVLRIIADKNTFIGISNPIMSKPRSPK